MNAECPICNKYPNIWKKLALEFPEFTFIGVFTSYEESKMAKGFIKKYKIPFQWFIDKENRLAYFLKVTTTPEVLFVDAKANFQLISIQIGPLNRLMDFHLKGHPYVKSPIDMACWDILGKVRNKTIPMSKDHFIKCF